jgi:hypothetical protein
VREINKILRPANRRMGQHFALSVSVRCGASRRRLEGIGTEITPAKLRTLKSPASVYLDRMATAATIIALWPNGSKSRTSRSG